MTRDREREKTTIGKRVAPSVVTIRSSYEWKWNMNFAWLLLRFLLLFLFSWKNMYSRSECRWITHERCSRAHTSYSKESRRRRKRNENWPLHSINNHFHSSHLKREIIQKMDKVKYLDWPTQNVDRIETYAYSCLYHWIEWEPLLNQTLIPDRDVVEFWLKISIDDDIHWDEDEENILIRSNVKFFFQCETTSNFKLIK